MLRVYDHIKSFFSLFGTAQLIWREYFYTMSVKNPNFDKIEGNPVCLAIPWLKEEESQEHLQAWKEGRTGYPWIDALQKQVRVLEKLTRRFPTWV